MQHTDSHTSHPPRRKYRLLSRALFLSSTVVRPARGTQGIERLRSAMTHTRRNDHPDPLRQSSEDTIQIETIEIAKRAQVTSFEMSQEFFSLLYLC